MKRILALLFCLAMVSILIASCGPKTETPTTTATTTTPTTAVTTKPTTTPTTAKPTVTTTPATTPVAEKPQYGGTINVGAITDPISFDPTDGSVYSEYYATVFIYEKMLIADWTKGPAGTKETPMTHFWNARPFTGSLAESYERPDLTTCIWRLRKGVRFQNIAPVNGREMTADDVVYSIERLKASVKVPITYYGDVISAKAIDKYTVEVKLKNPDSLFHFTTGIGSMMMVFPKEMVDKFGDLTKWQSACGTGPWIITDYINGSGMTFKKNPDYWGTDPINKGNKLPYADTVNQMIIVDASTRLSALRTGKIDVTVDYSYINWKDAQSLQKTNPELQRVGYEQATGMLALAMRTDKPPFSNIKVRQALHMATDFKGIVDNYLGGNGVLLNKPMMKMWGESVYTPLEKLPASVSKLFSYNPTEAKKLLAEAGYPNGFKTDLTYAPETFGDLMSLVKEWWGAIGVDVNLITKDTRTVQSIAITMPRPWEGVLGWRNGSSSPERTWSACFLTGLTWNVSTITDKYIDETYTKIISDQDVAKRDALIKQLNVYVLEQCYYIEGPSETSYVYWQPWLKNCYGAVYMDGWGSKRGIMYWWVDQSLKKQTGR